MDQIAAAEVVARGLICVDERAEKRQTEAMSLPLQPDLNPRDPRPRRQWLLLGLFALLVITAAILPVTQPSAQLLGNERGERPFWPTLIEHIDAAHHHIDAIVYVAHVGNSEQHPVRSVIAALGSARQRGVRVRVVLDRSPDWNSSDISTKNDRAYQLLHAVGVTVYSDELDRTTHSKAWAFDGHTAIIGSHNWTGSALTRNREWSVLVDDSSMAAHISKTIDTISAHADAVYRTGTK